MTKIFHYVAERSAGHWIFLRRTPNCIEYQKDFNFRFYLIRRNISMGWLHCTHHFLSSPSNGLYMMAIMPLTVISLQVEQGAAR